MQNAPCFRLLQMRRYIAICFPEPLLKNPFLEVEKTDQKLHLVTIDALLR